jgi:mono/diheme cytochrome c family protein
VTAFGSIRTFGTVLLAAGLASGIAGTAGAQQPAPALDAIEEAQARGKAIFMRYCALCHGADADGNGPIIDVLKVQPADLTRVAQRNGGTFPATLVANTIRDGRSGHGSSVMMAWGKILGDDGTIAASTAAIRDLTLYIETMQVK